MTSAKDKVRDTIYARRDNFIQLAHEIHEHPELAFTEEYAATQLTEFLAGEGFTVRKGICGIPTAFVATIGHGPLHIAFCAEYDALPPACLGAVSAGGPSSDQNGLGLAEVWLRGIDPGRGKEPESREAAPQHACGHNLIAGAAVAAATGLRDIVDQAGLTVSVIGTPGEELVGLPEPREGTQAAGKIALLAGGAFEGIHAALMVHPGPTPWSLFIPAHVYLRQRAKFSSSAGTGGRTVDAARLQRLEAALKQAAASLGVVPALFAARPESQAAGAQVDFLWISRTEAEGTGAREAVRRCFEEAASSAGVSVEIMEYAPGKELHNDPLLSASFRQNSEVLGRIRGRDEKIQEEIHHIFSLPQFPWVVRLLARLFPGLISPPGLFMNRVPAEVMYGTDLANVSQVIPAIHPMIGIGGMAGNHTVEFTAQADSEEGYQAMLDGGVALAWTALDAATDSAIKAHLLGSASS